MPEFKQKMTTKTLKLKMYTIVVVCGFTKLKKLILNMILEYDNMTTMLSCCNLLKTVL